MTSRPTLSWPSTAVTGLVVVLVLSAFAIGPLLPPGGGYFWGAHDAKNSVYFLYEFDKSIRDGILWPRWGPDWGFGYGYPFWNIYAPLAYYVGEVALLVGFDWVAAVKLVFALSFLGSAAAMYMFVRRLFGSAAAAISGLAYVYAPYHLFDVYVRAALAESFSFVFIPLVFWGFFELIDRPRIRAVVGAGLAYAGLVLTSNVLLVLITPVLGLMIVVLVLMRLREGHGAASGWRQSPAIARRLASLALPSMLGLALGFGLLAAFLLPALVERNFVRLDQWFGGRYQFGADFVYAFQLFSPAWGFGASLPGPDDKTGFQLGLVPVILFCLSFLVVPRLKEANIRRVARLWQIVTVLAAFGMTTVSETVWRAAPILMTVQFPWRLGVLTTTGLAVLAGAIVMPMEDGPAGADRTAQPRQANLPFVILVALVILGAYPYLRAEVREPRATEGPVSLAALFRYQQASDEMTGATAWASRIPGWSPLAEQVARGGTIDTKINYAAISDDQKLGVHSVEMDTVHELVWVYAADDQQSVTFFTAYYPGWTAYVYQDLGQPANDLKARVGPLVASPTIHATPHEGWIVAPVPAGEHFLELRFEDTPVRLAGKAISLVSVVSMFTAIAVVPRVRARLGDKGVAGFIRARRQTQTRQTGR